MDSLVTAAARALAAGDPLAALNRIALRDDPPALALRGIAMAQLGDLDRARQLLRRAARAFGPREAMSRARCIVAEAEVALASRDLGWQPRALAAARATLESHGDRVNAAHASYLEIRRLLLIGHVDDAERQLAGLDPTALPPALGTTHALITAGIALRRVQSTAARDALSQALFHAQRAGIPALLSEVERASEMLDTPAARLIDGNEERPLRLDEVERLRESDALLVDACRYTVSRGEVAISLARRPVLFCLAQALAEHWPADVPRNTLIARAFRTCSPDETHRARLRVEIGRLRKALIELAEVKATPRGFILAPLATQEVCVLARPLEERHAGVLACLADGEAWSSSALALALGASQRTVQRALDTLAESGKVQSFGQGRAQRWTAPTVPGFATTLLLPTPWSGN
ncbi:helix-turn-helix domain-containing protein [Pseudomonas sp. 30_B]|uniref:helix-turn-helix domain-containing protein n=1 Tax=Pseudomonas sp. 30_B TaxID=2813575 RepID=UPI001A9F670B|nr:helix-turn-helix domain-containing protein [Pseudomonas sp. 30_B]